MKKSILFLMMAMTATSFSALSFADEEGAFLDAPYPNPVHPITREQSPFLGLLRLDLRRGATKSDTNALIAKMTPVRNQKARGTCSIFSATAMLEGMMVVAKGADPKTLDLSEEWLEYVITRGTADDGSTSNRNFAAFKQYGDAEETEMPYIGETWKALTDSTLAQKRCGKLTGFNQKACLVAHRDPRLLDASDKDLSDRAGDLFDTDFLAARDSAQQFQKDNLAKMSSDYYVYNEDDVKDLLRQGIPVTLDLEFYYGAWNHREAVNLGINRDMANWTAGIVGYPEIGSVDREKSPTDRAGHSILVVGYDDDAEVTTTQLMSDGTTKQFSYKGVYYFKNSWGTENFGVTTKVDGVTQPGYGVITQKYAHEYGTFFKLPLQ